MRLASLTYLEVEQAVAAGAVALWPVGSIEAHGPHLPLGTDLLIAEEVCVRALPLVSTLNVKGVILPSLSFTVTEYAAPFRGTLSLPRETVLAYVRDVAVAVSQQGFRALCLVNGHLEPAHRFMLRDAVKAARAMPGCRCPVGIANPADARFASSLTEEFKSGACHAGQYETSLILAARPQAVREDARSALPARTVDLLGAIKAGARTFLEVGMPEAYTGDPAAASTEEGIRSLHRLAEITEIVVGELLQEGSRGS